MGSPHTSFKPGADMNRTSYEILTTNEPSTDILRSSAAHRRYCHTHCPTFPYFRAPDMYPKYFVILTYTGWASPPRLALGCTD